MMLIAASSSQGRQRVDLRPKSSVRTWGESNDAHSVILSLLGVFNLFFKPFN
jgi:hypothetical protein